MGEYDTALDNIEFAAEYYIEYDNNPGGMYTSAMTNKLEYNKEQNWTSAKDGRLCNYQFEYYSADKRFDPLRGHERFEAVLQKLKG